MLHAIIAGLNRYADERVPALKFAVADAQELAALLNDRVAEDERRVRLFLDQEATQRNISMAVNEAARAVRAKDVVIIYFAGHGAPEKGGAWDKRSRYLLTYDTDYSNIYGTSLGMETHVPQWLELLSQAKLTVLILDCCFSGGAGGRTVIGPLMQLAGLKMMPSPPVSLKNLELGRGRVILCASDEDQVAAESSTVAHGVFTHHLLAALKRHRGEERTILLGSLYEEVARAVSEETAGAQVPIMTALPNRQAALPSLSASVEAENL